MRGKESTFETLGKAKREMGSQGQGAEGRPIPRVRRRDRV